jgi:hypothetical protein
MTISPVVSQVADGRRLAARQLVMNTLGTIPCQVWRKRVIYNDPATPTQTGLSWSAISLSEQDEPDYEYDPIGYAYTLLDRFTGANVLRNNSMVDGADVAIMAQIEPYDEAVASKRQQVMQVPAWLPKQGDVLALLIMPEIVLWLEVVDIMGASMVSDFGKKYVLNKRDDLTSLEPFKTELEDRLEP